MICPAYSPSVQAPASLGAVAQRTLEARHRPHQLRQLFDRSPVPMLMVDDEHRYVAANRPARLVFRMSLAETRRLAIGDLTSADRRGLTQEAWERLLETGCVAGASRVAGPDGSELDVVFYGLAHALPGRHLIMFAPAGWTKADLGDFDTDSNGVGPDGVASLTPREQELLALAAEGFTGPEIADRLFVSPATVKTHFSNIYEKLDVSGRPAAVAKGLRLGLIV